MRLIGLSMRSLAIAIKSYIHFSSWTVVLLILATLAQQNYQLQYQRTFIVIAVPTIPAQINWRGSTHAHSWGVVHKVTLTVLIDMQLPKQWALFYIY